MRNTTIALGCAGALLLSACGPLTEQERQLAGGVAGAAAGLVTASLLTDDRNWRIVGALAGAAAGTLVARNQQTGQCAYAVGDGTFRTGPCPR